MPRRYSEEEAQRIFALVADRQRSAGGVDGLSLAELEEAARAAGLDPALVSVAAAELDAAPHPEKTLAGAPVEVISSRVVPGPLSDDAWAEMVGAMRREFSQPGMAGQIGRLREWTVISGGAKNGTVTRLTAEPTPDGTRITLSRSVREIVFGFSLASLIQLAMATVFGAMALAGVDPELWIATIVMSGMGALFGLGAQIGARVWQRRERDRFQVLLDRLELASHVSERPPETAGVSAAPRLDLDALNDAPAEVVSPERRRQRS